AKMLSKKIAEHGVNVWLVNTGWVAGPYGVGHRMSLSLTRSIIDLILDGGMAEKTFTHNDLFNLDVPHGVAFTQPNEAWEDQGEYAEAAKNLIEQFHANAATLSLSKGVLASGM